MLILVGVTISVALNGGLFGKGEKTAFQTEVSTIKEQLEFAKAEKIMDNNGKALEDYSVIKVGELAGLDKKVREKYENMILVDKAGNVCYNPAEVTDQEKKGWLEEIGINPYQDSNVKLDFAKIKQDVIANPEKYLEKAKAAGQDTEALTDIGIGTDGEVVNLDLWAYYLDEGEIYIQGDGSHGSTGYKGTFINNGEIEGTIPQYIYSEGEIYPVVGMRDVFYNLTELKVAPKLPETVRELGSTFTGCTGLTVAPEIPENVTDLTSVFYECTGLTTAPKIPSNVGCVISLFAGCVNLTGTIVIDSDVINTSDYFNYASMLNGVGSAEKPIVLKGTGNNLEILEAIKTTGNSEYITIEQ